MFLLKERRRGWTHMCMDRLNELKCINKNDGYPEITKYINYLQLQVKDRRQPTSMFCILNN